MKERYYIRFGDALGRACRVSIMTVEDDGAEAVELTGGTTPLYTETGMADGVTEPVATGSGRLTVTGGAEVAEALFCEGAMSKLVVLTVDGDVRWRGYLTADSLDQAAWPAVTDVTANVQSVTGALEGVQITGGKSVESAAQMLMSALDATGVEWRNIYWPKDIVQSEGSSDLWFVWRINMLRSRMTGEESEVSDDSAEGWTYLEWLQEWCRLWGWRMVEDGLDIWFTDRECTEYCFVSTTQMRLLSGTVQTKAVTTWQDSDWQAADDDVRRTWEQGRRGITVKAEAEKQDAEMSDVWDWAQLAGSRVFEQTKSEGDPPLIKVLSQTKVVQFDQIANGMAEVMSYKLNEEAQWVRDTAKCVPGVWTNGGARLIRAGGYKTGGESDTGEPGWNIEDIIDILSGDLSLNSNDSIYGGGVQMCYPAMLPLLRLKSTGNLCSAKAALLLNFEIKAANWWWSWWAKDGIYESQDGTKEENPYAVFWKNLYFTFRLKIGDKYWNGGGWSFAESTFRVYPVVDEEAEWHKIKDQRNNYDEKTGYGYVIPLNGSVTGRIELTLMSVELGAGSILFFFPDFAGADVLFGLHYYLRNFGLTYVEPDGIATSESDGDVTYRRECSGKWKEREEISLKLMTDERANNNTAALLTSNGLTRLGKVWSMTAGKAAYAEELLADKLKRVYDGAVVTEERGVVAVRGVTPGMMTGRRWLLGWSSDWRGASKRVRLISF